MEVNYRRIPFRGWNKCTHAAAAFDSRGEYAAALCLDGASSVLWWLRNDPPVLRIASPAGFFEPDFLYARRVDSKWVYGILEIKGDIFWDGEGSEARLKANAAEEWVRAINAVGPETSWEFAVILDSDAETTTSLEAMRNSRLYPVYP
jgi:hypothetical protein